MKLWDDYFLWLCEEQARLDGALGSAKSQFVLGCEDDIVSLVKPLVEAGLSVGEVAGMMWDSYAPPTSLSRNYSVRRLFWASLRRGP
jgi:hypothetical protein